MPRLTPALHLCGRVLDRRARRRRCLPREAAAFDLLGDRLGSVQGSPAIARVERRAQQPARRGADDYDLLKLRSQLSTGLSQIGDE